MYHTSFTMYDSKRCMIVNDVYYHTSYDSKRCMIVNRCILVNMYMYDSKRCISKRCMISMYDSKRCMIVNDVTSKHVIVNDV